MDLETCLRAYRMNQARIRHISLIFVFSDILMKSIVSVRPRTISALSDIRGMGPSRLSNYGNDIIEMVGICAPTQTKNVMVKHSSATKLRKPRPRPQTAGMRTITTKKTTGKTGIAKKTFDMDCDKEDDVYILELARGRVYVGKTGCIDRRVGQHMAGSGSAFTKAFPPTGVLLPRLGNVRGSGDSAERDETLRYMFLRGIESVRGWKYVQVDLTPAQIKEAESNIRELFDFCRRCGCPNHFQSQCKSTFDRNGKRITRLV